MDPESQTSNPRKLRMIQVKGSHRQVGQQIGEACRPQIQHSLISARNLLNDAFEDLHLTWEAAHIQASKYTPFSIEFFPQYVEEIRGIAEGSGVTYDNLMLLNAMEAVTSDALHLSKCTSIAINQEKSENGHVLVGHNEDWVPEDESDIFIVHAELDDEPPFLAMTYGGLLPNNGFNAYGIAQCCDTVYPNDSRVGIPRLILSRAVLAASKPSQAISATIMPHRAAGYNHLLAHESGEIYCVEVSAKNFAILYGEEGFLVHTNHYQNFRMEEVESEPYELISTRVRCFRALRLMKQRPLHSVSSLQAILSDHVNLPDSICNHDVKNDPLVREKTISSVVFDLTTRTLYATWGNPCENPYFTYQLSC